MDDLDKRLENLGTQISPTPAREVPVGHVDPPASSEFPGRPDGQEDKDEETTPVDGLP